MSAEPVHGPARHLRAALRQLAGPLCQIVHHTEQPWASVTFEGARHRVALLFAGDAAVTAGEAFIAALPDHEFTLPGKLVADATVAEIDHSLIPAPRLAVACELLVLDDV